MKRILIISPFSGQQTSDPCGKDLYNIAKALAFKQGFSVDILSTLSDENTENLKVYKVLNNNDFYQKRQLDIGGKFISSSSCCMRIIGKILNRLIGKCSEWCGYYSKMNYRQFVNFVSNITEQYDLIISVSNPVYSHDYALYAKRKLKIKKWIAFYLDLYADNPDIKEKKRAIKREEKIFKNSSRIFSVEGFVNKANYSNIQHYMSKVTLVPYHMIVDKTSTDVVDNKDGKIHLLFAGRFYQDIRNPEKFFKVIQILPDNFVVDLYSRGCEDLVNKYHKIMPNKLRIHNFECDSIKYDRILQNSDILISIGNNQNTYVPSKVYEYCSYGKPIIHFVNCVEDIATVSLKNYPAICFIDYHSSAEVIEKEVAQYCLQKQGHQICYDEIKRLLNVFTLDHIIDKITDLL